MDALLTMFSKYFKNHPILVIVLILMGAYIIPLLNTLGTKSGETIWELLTVVLNSGR